MRLWPRSLAGQMVLVLILALAAAQLIALAMLLQDRERALVLANRGQVVDRTIGLVRVLAITPEAAQAAVIEAMRAPGFMAQLADRSLIPGETDEHGQEADHARDNPLARFIQRHVASAGAGPVMANLDETSWFERRRWRDHHAGPVMGLALAIRLPDGQWLNLRHDLRPPAFWRGGTLIYIGLTALLVCLAGYLMVRRITRPVRALAEAAEQLGRGAEVPPLAETGPAELARAAAAFNRMQERIRRFVQDRTRMLAAISHDLRTPITTLRLRAELLDDDEQREKILETLAEMQAMTEATLAFVREEAKAEALRQTDLGALVESIADDLRDQGAEVTTAPSQRQVIACRPVALKRALRNIIENAVRYGEQTSVSVERSADTVRVLVDDKGPGIAEADLDRVFEPFVRLEESRSRETGGSGLGLAIARSIVRGHGGDITLANRQDGGLRVTVSLPSE